MWAFIVVVYGAKLKWLHHQTRIPAAWHAPPPRGACRQVNSPLNGRFEGEMSLGFGMLVFGVSMAPGIGIRIVQEVF